MARPTSIVQHLTREQKVKILWPTDLLLLPPGPVSVFGTLDPVHGTDTLAWIKPYPAGPKVRGIPIDGPPFPCDWAFVFNNLPTDPAVPFGGYHLEVQTTDEHGNIARDYVRFLMGPVGLAKVVGAPVVHICSPAVGAHLCGTFSTWGTITPKDVVPTGTLEDNAGHTVATGTAGGVPPPPYNWTINFLTLPPPGQYNLVVEGTNAAGTG
jgi:hypothetical protein